MVITFKGLPGKGDRHLKVGHLAVGISELTVRSFLRRHKPDIEKEVQEERLSLEKSRHSKVSLQL